MASSRAEESTAPRERVGFFSDLWRTSSWRVFPLLVIYVVCLTLLTPIKPNLMTDFFASRGSTHYIHCERYEPQYEPQACRDAHSTVVAFSSWSDFFSNTVLLFLLAPQVGKWSDIYGRRPFLMATFLCASTTVLVLFLNLNYGLSMYFYFPAQAINGALSSLSICMAYIADKLQPEHRAPAFGLVLCSFSVGILVGPLGGGYLPPAIASTAALAGMLFCILYVAAFIPESTTERSRQEARKKQLAEKGTLRGPWQGLAILWRSRLFIKLTITVMILGIVSEGLYELLMQYFQITLHFSSVDQAHMFVLAGICGTFTQLVVLRVLLKYVGKLRMLLIGIACSIIEMAMLTYVWSKPVALLAISIGAIGNITFPAISSIKSLHVAESEQGAVQGALQGARALAQGLGPLIFAGLFALFTKSWSPLPYFPGAPFACGTLLLVIGFAVAATIDSSHADGGLNSSESAVTEPLLSQETGDEEAPAEDKPQPPSAAVMVQHDGPAMVLDQMPEIAIDALAHFPEAALDEGGLSGGESAASSSGCSSG